MKLILTPTWREFNTAGAYQIYAKLWYLMENEFSEGGTEFYQGC